MESLLSVNNLTAGYGHTEVLHGLSFEVSHGGITAIIGPNGHGKSTLLRTLSGLNATWSGTVVFDGKPLPKGAPDRAHSGLVLVPQGDQLFIDMSVEENLLMGAFSRNDSSRINQSLTDVYTLFPKLKERHKQRASSLSGGERRMVGIGRGMMADGKLLMIDEPSLGLAPLIIEQIYEALGLLASQGSSILVVEENPSRVSNIALQFHLVDGGHFAWSGNAQDLSQSGDILKTYLGG